MTDPRDGDSQEIPWEQLSPIRRVLRVVVTAAYVVMFVWFASAFAGRDSIPMAIEAASDVAAVVVIGRRRDALGRPTPQSRPVAIGSAANPSRA